jgi:ribose 5-phosphate isomerase B
VSEDKVDEKSVRKMVRRVVYRTLGLDPESEHRPKRALITEADLRDLSRGEQFTVPEGALVTPLARQIALERRLELVPEKGNPQPTMVVGTIQADKQTQQRTVAIGADHGGYQMKQDLKEFLGDLGYSVVDCGTDSSDSVDYPDYAFAVAQLVAQGRAWRGIMVDGAGIGSCMAANKVPGVRAAMCYDQATAVNSREHNDANVLTLGAGLIGRNLARQIVKAWLETASGGDRHSRRVNKIMDIEKRFLKKISP